MKNPIIITLTIIAIILLGLMFWGKGAEKTPDTNQVSAGQTAVKEESKQDQNTHQGKRPNKMCARIEASDLVISLDLPEKYAHYNDRTIFPT